MKKKIGWAFIAIVVICGVVFGSQFLFSKGHEGEKEISIQVIDATKDPEKEVLKETYYTDAKTLTDFLEETDGLNVDIEQGEYGSLLYEIAGLQQNMDTGPWLVFESENNTVCKEAGMCPAMDKVVIEDGDSFTFQLISSFE